MILKLHKSRAGEDPAAIRLSKWLQHHGYPVQTVSIERVLRAEGISESDFKKLQPLFSHTAIEQCSAESTLVPGNGPVLEISYQRAMTDPEFDSIRHAAAALGITAIDWARLAVRYQLGGVDQTTAQEIAERYLLNKQIQTVITSEWPTLIPQGGAGTVELFDIARMSLAELRKLSDTRRLLMSDEKLSALQSFARNSNRTLRDAEIEMTAAAWSDHCSHETWRSMKLFQALKAATMRIQHPLMFDPFVDNSGKMIFYDGWVINFKGETHISPTFAGDPYGGIMTKHGGVIRDILWTGQGAYPIAGTTIMATGDPRILWDQVPSGAFHPLTVVKESIRGTHDYCNPMGIPMAWSQYLVDARNWKGVALGHSVGILPFERAKKNDPHPGDFVVLMGGPTGIDGIHGATVSSASMTSETSVRDAAHVQIGMPIEERKLMEAVPVLRDANCVRATTDCGAAGLSSAVGEMGSACGVWVNLAWLKLKCLAMEPWQKWLSESQERGVMATPPHKLAEALSILKRYGVPALVIGVFTDSERCQVVDNPSLNQTSWLEQPSACMDGTVAVDLPYSFLTADCPLPNISVREPLIKPEHFTVSIPKNQKQWIELVQQVLGHYNICDQSAAAHQFDQTVQGKTVLPYVSGPNERMPDELFVSAPLHGKPYGVGIANAINQTYSDIDPAMCGRLMLASATTKLVAAGFSPSDINFCGNVCSPPVHGSPENAWRLEQLVTFGYVPGTEEIGIPVTSGKDSSSCRFKNTATGTFTDAPLTLDILAVGRIPDANKIIRKAFAQAGDLIVLYSPGLKKIALGGSILYDLAGQRGNELPEVDLKDLRQGLEVYHQLIANDQKTHSRSAIAEGGLLRRLFESCYGSKGLGCCINLPSGDPLELLFAHLHGSILFTTTSTSLIHKLVEHYTILGSVVEEPIIEVSQFGKKLFSCTVERAAEKWNTTFKELM